MDGFGLFGTAVSLVLVKLAEKGLVLLVVGSGDRVRSGLEGGTGGRVDCGVDSGGATRNLRDDNGDVRGWENRLGQVWKSEFEVLAVL